MPTGEYCWMKNSGIEPATLDYKPHALPTDLRREICGVGFKLLLYSAII